MNGQVKTTSGEWTVVLCAVSDQPMAEYNLHTSLRSLKDRYTHLTSLSASLHCRFSCHTQVCSHKRAVVYTHVGLRISMLPHTVHKSLQRSVRQRESQYRRTCNLNSEYIQILADEEWSARN